MDGPVKRNRNRLVAVALLDEQELKNLTTGFKRVYPLPADGSFDDLLTRLDIATRRDRCR